MIPGAQLMDSGGSAVNAGKACYFLPEIPDSCGDGPADIASAGRFAWRLSFSCMEDKSPLMASRNARPIGEFGPIGMLPLTCVPIPHPRLRLKPRIFASGIPLDQSTATFVPRLVCRLAPTATLATRSSSGGGAIDTSKLAPTRVSRLMLGEKFDHRKPSKSLATVTPSRVPLTATSTLYPATLNSVLRPSGSRTFRGLLAT